MSLLIPKTAPLSTLPVLSRDSAELRVYDNYPDKQAWLEDALARGTRAGESERQLGLLAELGARAWGAPLGPDTEESLRVARTTGVFVEDREGVKEAVGVAFAHARMWGYWVPSRDGPVLTLEIQEPRSYGWGVGKDTFAQEQLKAVSLRQLKPLATSLLQNVADAHEAARLSVTFTGRWDESSQFVRRALVRHSLVAWHRATLPPGDASSLQSAN